MNILDKGFKYTPAAKTDIRKTFARIRREQNAARQGTASVVRADRSEGLKPNAPAVSAPNLRRIA